MPTGAPAHQQQAAASSSTGPQPIPMPIPSGISRVTSISRSASARRQSQSTGSGGAGSIAGSTGVARRPSRVNNPPVPPKPLTHQEALEALRSFLKERSSYDVFPVSFRLIVLDVQLKVKKALDVLLLYGQLQSARQANMCSSDVPGVVSAPLWSTETAKFAG